MKEAEMKKTSWTWVVSGLALAVLVVASASSSCAKKPKLARTGDVTQSAIATYVAPGDLDQYYLFYSGGHSGNVYVAGVPSMRHIATIPVFTPYPGTGYGFDKATKEMLGVIGRASCRVRGRRGAVRPQAGEPGRP